LGKIPCLGGVWGGGTQWVLPHPVPQKVKYLGGYKSFGWGWGLFSLFLPPFPGGPSRFTPPEFGPPPPYPPVTRSPPPPPRLFPRGSPFFGNIKPLGGKKGESPLGAAPTRPFWGGLPVFLGGPVQYGKYFCKNEVYGAFVPPPPSFWGVFLFVKPPPPQPSGPGQRVGGPPR